MMGPAPALRLFRSPCLSKAVAVPWKNVSRIVHVPVGLCGVTKLADSFAGPTEKPAAAMPDV